MSDYRLPSAVASEEPHSRIDGEIPVDHERLRYVTTLLADQPGLSSVLFGTYFFLWKVWEILDWPSGWWTLVALLVAVVGLRIYFAAYQHWIPAYYQQRFGSVARKPWSKWDALFFLAGLFFLAIFILFSVPIAHSLDPVTSYLHRMISDPGREINLLPLVLWVAGLCWSLRWRMRSSIERRRLYFLLAMLVGIAAIVFYPIRHPDAKQLILWKVLNAGSLGLGLIVLGLYDYISLVLLLPKRVAEGDDE